jgi:hypothetical protein
MPSDSLSQHILRNGAAVGATARAAEAGISQRDAVISIISVVTGGDPLASVIACRDPTGNRQARAIGTTGTAGVVQTPSGQDLKRSILDRDTAGESAGREEK